MELARAGAKIIIAARSEAKGLGAAARIEREIVVNDAKGTVHFLPLDLASLDSVEKFAKAFKALRLNLHVLVLNAGVMKSPGQIVTGQSFTYGYETTRDGFEYHIGVNHIGHAHLVQLLLDSLKSTAKRSPGDSRIVSVSSAAEDGAPDSGMVFDEWVPTKGVMPEAYEDGRAYGQSKLANLMYARELSLRLDGSGVEVFACHPGAIVSDLGRYLRPMMKEELKAKNFVRRTLGAAFLSLFDMAAFSTKDGALT